MVNMRSVGTGKSSVEDVVFPSIPPGEPEDLTFLDILLIITRRKKLVGFRHLRKLRKREAKSFHS